MRRLALFGLLLALPLVAVPLMWGAAGGSVGGGSLDEFRAARPTQPRPLVEAVAATPRRVSFLVNRAAGIEVVVRDPDGALVRRLGHFTVPARKRLILTWDGSDAPGGSVAVVKAAGQTFRAPVRVRRWARADDADRQSLRQPGNAWPD